MQNSYLVKGPIRLIAKNTSNKNEQRRLMNYRVVGYVYMFKGSSILEYWKNKSQNFHVPGPKCRNRWWRRSWLWCWDGCPKPKKDLRWFELDSFQFHSVFDEPHKKADFRIPWKDKRVIKLTLSIRKYQENVLRGPGHSKNVCDTSMSSNYTWGREGVNQIVTWHVLTFLNNYFNF